MVERTRRAQTPAAAVAEARSPGIAWWFYVAACFWAAAAVPIWVLTDLGVLTGGLTPARHAHDMLSGYALAVVAGFLLTRLSRPRLMLCLAAWAVARLADGLDLPCLISGAAGLALPCLIFFHAGVPFLRTAKSAHNLPFGPIMGLFCLAEMLYRAGCGGLLQDGEAKGNLLLVDAVALLLFIMGGRIIAAAVAGALSRAGQIRRGARRQWPEWYGAGGLALALIGGALSLPDWLSATGHVMAGCAAAIRLFGWARRPALRHPDISVLLPGYAWLGFGETLRGLTAFLDLPPLAGLHAVTVGGLGTLATMMMARVTIQQSRGAQPFGALPMIVAAGLSIAAAARLGAAFAPGTGLLAIAAVAWSAAHLGLGGFLIGAAVARRRVKKERAGVRAS